MNSFKSYFSIIQVLLLFGFTGFFSCGARAQQMASEVKEVKAPKLLFLNYTISKYTNGTYRATFINKVLTEGRLKDKTQRQPLSDAGDIVCIQYNDKNDVLDRSYIKNPLQPIVEYVNDDGNLEKRQLNLNSAQIAIKLQLQEATSSVRLFLIDASGNASTDLITTSIR